MTRLSYALRYSFFMVQAHLAEMMGDDDTADEMLSIANGFHQKWVQEKVNADHRLRPI